jgi:TolB-like protein
MAATITDKSIAVLPFLDMSEKKDQEYFGDGMAEEILDLLVKIPDSRSLAAPHPFSSRAKMRIYGRSAPNSAQPMYWKGV